MTTKIRTLIAGLGTGLAMLCSMAHAEAAPAKLTPVTLVTTWYAQAEQGGFYAAKAEGIYKKYGLDVTIRMGGPQVNAMQLMLGGIADFSMGYSLQTLNAVNKKLPVVTVAAFFQKDPQSLLVHTGVGNDSLEALKGKPIRLATAGRVAFWPWLKAKYGFTDDQLRPYDFTIGPFILDPQAIQQGYVTNDGYLVAKQKTAAKSLLLADNGWLAYQNTLDTTQKMIDTHPEIVQAMVKATAEGWEAYMRDPGPANKLIKKDNPKMEDGMMTYAFQQMKAHELVNSGDAAGAKAGMMTDARWKAFFDQMVAAHALPADLDYHKAYALRFIDAAYAN